MLYNIIFYSRQTNFFTAHMPVASQRLAVHFNLYF